MDIFDGHSFRKWNCRHIVVVREMKTSSTKRKYLLFLGNIPWMVEILWGTFPSSSILTTDNAADLFLITFTHLSAERSSVIMLTKGTKKHMHEVPFALEVKYSPHCRNLEHKPLGINIKRELHICGQHIGKVHNSSWIIYCFRCSIRLIFVININKHKGSICTLLTLTAL
jgi:hypothetical protein